MTQRCQHHTPEPWHDFDGTPLKFEDGDYVRIDISDNPARATELPFLEGYVRGYDTSERDGISSVAYELFKVGHNPLRWVREKFLSLTPGQFGINHGKGAHGNGESCHLCGANL